MAAVFQNAILIEIENVNHYISHLNTYVELEELQLLWPFYDIISQY